METWSLRHPELGLIEVERGYDSEFSQLYPDWPQQDSRKEKKKKARNEEEAAVSTEKCAAHVREPGPNAQLPERIKSFASNPSARLQVRVNGEVRARFATVSTARIALDGDEDTSKLRNVYSPVNRAKPHVYIQSNFLHDILNVEYRQGSQVVEFVAPAGSRGEKRRKAMEESGFKRVAYPLMSGLGKGGWALAIVILGPLLGRILNWILSLFPDWNLRLPSFDIDLPVLPQIHLPVPNWPPLPHFDIPQPPAWVLFLLEYSKIWVPILIGLVIGIVAIRNHRKSEQEKTKWREVPSAPEEEPVADSDAKD